MPFSGHSEPPRVGESELDAAHDVPRNLGRCLGNDEGLWAALENLHEKVGTIILRQADTIDLNDR